MTLQQGAAGKVSSAAAGLTAVLQNWDGTTVQSVNAALEGLEAICELMDSSVSLLTEVNSQGAYDLRIQLSELKRDLATLDRVTDTSLGFLRGYYPGAGNVAYTVDGTSREVQA